MQIDTLPDPPILIVSSRLADECMWAEALNFGAYDVLAKPFDTEEVIRVLSLGWLHRKRNVTPDFSTAQTNNEGGGNIHFQQLSPVA